MISRILIALALLAAIALMVPAESSAWYPVPTLENDHGQCVSIGGYNAELYFRSSFEGNCGGVCGPLVDVTINGEYWEIIVQGGFGGGCGACSVDLLDQAFVIASGTYENCMGSSTGGCLSANPWC